MNVEMAANYADVIGAVAVVISLIYVGIQVRNNTQVNRGIATQQTFASTQTIYSWHAHNKGASELYAKFSQGQPLSVAETVRMHHLMMGMIEQYQLYYILRELKMMDDESFSCFFRKILQVLATPASKSWFFGNRNFFRKDFVADVEKLLDENAHVAETLSRFYGVEGEVA